MVSLLKVGIGWPARRFTFSCWKNCWRSVRLLSRHCGRSRTMRTMLWKESSCLNCEGKGRGSFWLQCLVVLPVVMVLRMMVVLPMLVVLPTLAVPESVWGQQEHPIRWSCAAPACDDPVSSLFHAWSCSWLSVMAQCAIYLDCGCCLEHLFNFFRLF